MSNKTQLQTNNTALDALITRVNAAKEAAAGLPEAGGSGGGNVETCNVTINYVSDFGCFGHIDYTSLNDNALIYTRHMPASGSYTYGSISVTLNNVVCNTTILIEAESMSSIIVSDGIIAVQGDYSPYIVYSNTTNDGTIIIDAGL